MRNPSFMTPNPCESTGVLLGCLVEHRLDAPPVVLLQPGEDPRIDLMEDRDRVACPLCHLGRRNAGCQPGTRRRAEARRDVQ